MVTKRKHNAFIATGALFLAVLMGVSLKLYADSESSERARTIRNNEVAKEIAKVEKEIAELKSENESAITRGDIYKKESSEWYKKFENDWSVRIDKSFSTRPSSANRTTTGQSGGVVIAGFDECMTFSIQNGLDRRVSRQFCNCYMDYYSSGLSQRESALKCGKELIG